MKRTPFSTLRYLSVSFGWRFFACRRTCCVWFLAIAATTLFPRGTCAAETKASDAAALLRKLINKEPVAYVALGDSITYGLDLPRGAEDSFATQFFHLLSEAFQNPQLRYVNAGVPGDTVDQGLNRLPALLKKYRPDLMTVQFGGNDFRVAVPIDEFERDLTAIVETARQECSTCVIFITPPMAADAPEFDASVVKAVRHVAQMEGAPVVDADTLLKDSPHDYRGLFPYNAHPTSFSHREMARLLWREFCKWSGYPVSVQARMQAMASIVDLSQPVVVPVQLANQSDHKQTCRLSLTVGPVVYRDEVVLQPKEDRHRLFLISLPEMLAGVRSVDVPLRLGLWTENGYTCDLKYLTVSPLVSVQERDAKSQQRCHLDFGNIVLGKSFWDGPADLSAAFYVTRGKGTLRVNISITDDLLVPAPVTKPHDGDSVEIYLDLRKPERQGQPFFTNETVILYAIPNPATRGPATIVTSEPDPKKLTDARAASTRTENGYELQVDIPMQWFELYGKEVSSGFGFDIAVNDGDGRNGRETQMIWAGSDLDYLNPALFGALTLQSPLPPHAARVTIQ